MKYSVLVCLAVSDSWEECVCGRDPNYVGISSTYLPTSVQFIWDQVCGHNLMYVYDIQYLFA